MLDTKSLIIAEILKQEGPFRARHIWEPLGLTTQNVGNHLSRLVSKGILIKSGITYELESKERLVDEMVNSGQRMRLESAKPVGAFYPMAEAHQTTIDYTVRARMLEKSGATEMHVVLNQMIDDTIEEMKKLKKWLNHKTYVQSRAEDGFDSEMWDSLKDMFLK